MSPRPLNFDDDRRYSRAAALDASGMMTDENDDVLRSRFELPSLGDSIPDPIRRDDRRDA